MKIPLLKSKRASCLFPVRGTSTITMHRTSSTDSYTSRLRASSNEGALHKQLQLPLQRALRKLARNPKVNFDSLLQTLTKSGYESGIVSDSWVIDGLVQAGLDESLSRAFVDRGEDIFPMSSPSKVVVMHLVCSTIGLCNLPPPKRVEKLRGFLGNSFRGNTTSIWAGCG